MLPVSDAASEDPIVRTIPQAAAAIAPAVTPPAAPAAPWRDALAAVMPTAPAAPIMPVEPAAPILPVAERAAPEPAPAVTASLMPRALPEAAEERPLLSAPMVFEAPKPTDAQVLTEMPKIKVIVAAPEPVAPAATLKQIEKPVQQANLSAEPSPAEFLKTVSTHLPLPKPPLSPAQRLELQGKDYDKAEKCLEQAIYFEARNEPARGQQAVAQVVLNGVFSPYYPKDVCSVVYQNAHRHLSCQFTFACDGKPEAVNERGAWQRANRIATPNAERQGLAA